MRIGVFGCGNMGSALVLGIKSKYPNAQFFLYTPSQDKASALALKINGINVGLISNMPKDLDWYLLALKPQNIDEFNFEFSKDTKIISILAGINTSKLKDKFNSNKIVRLMPNTPSVLSMGANLLFIGSNFSVSEIEEIKLLLTGTGQIFIMTSEIDLDITTVFSASGPALVFELARIFESELTRLTNGRVLSKDIIAQTFYGSTTLMNSIVTTDSTFEDLCSQVTSKKGVTFEALEVLKNNNIQGIFSNAFESAYKRINELNK